MCSYCVCLFLSLSVQLEASVADFNVEPFPEVYNLEDSCSEVRVRGLLCIPLAGTSYRVTMATLISRLHAGQAGG